MLFVDESGFYLLPFVARTYAPRGRTPVLHARLTRDHLSAITAVAPNGRLLVHVRRRAFKGSQVVAFLRALLRAFRGKLLIVWDRGPIHRARVVTAFLATRAGRRIQVEWLPAYAPELNPAEGVWGHLKRWDLPNVRCPRLGGLHRALRGAVRRLGRKRAVVRGFFRHTGLY